MSVQIHCDQCDESLHTRHPFTMPEQPELFELYRTPRYSNSSYSEGYVFCDARCAGLFFMGLSTEEASDDADAE